MGNYFCANPKCPRHVEVDNNPCRSRVLMELDKDFNRVEVKQHLFHFPSSKPEFNTAVPFCDACKGAVDLVVQGFEEWFRH